MKAPDWLLANKVTLPCRRRGRAKIERYSLTAKFCEQINWRIVMHAQDRCSTAPTCPERSRRMAVPDWAYPGKYTGLVVDGITVTSDEAHEIADQLPFIERASGHVLLTGLGIGMCLQALLRKPDVEHVTVVEECADVLHLVAPHYLAMFGDIRQPPPVLSLSNGWLSQKRMRVVHADALSWQPEANSRWDFAFHDIWPVAVGSFWPQHERLYAHYDGYVDHQESWRADWMKERFEKGVAGSA